MGLHAPSAAKLRRVREIADGARYGTIAGAEDVAKKKELNQKWRSNNAHI